MAAITILSDFGAQADGGQTCRTIWLLRNQGSLLVLTHFRCSSESAQLWDTFSFCIIFIYCLVPGFTMHSLLQKLLSHLASSRRDSPVHRTRSPPRLCFLSFPLLLPGSLQRLCPMSSCTHAPVNLTLLMSLLHKWLPSLPFYSFLFLSWHLNPRLTPSWSPQNHKAQRILEIDKVELVQVVGGMLHMGASSSVHGVLQAKNPGVGCHFLLQGLFIGNY